MKKIIIFIPSIENGGVEKNLFIVSNYLKKNGYKLLTNKYKPLDENSINWNAITVSNFNYKIRQDGGKKNALGLIKFIFPNKHSIYIHDTPSKRYFNS